MDRAERGEGDTYQTEIVFNKQDQKLIPPSTQVLSTKRSTRKYRIDRGGSRILERGVLLYARLLPKAVHRGV